MLFRTLALVALATTTIAHQLNDKHLHFHEARGLDKRQSTESFAPSTTTATGDTCADAFGAGYETCREASGSTNRLCYNPSIGQTCCSNSYACPSGSFCLNSGNCCPNGLDPSTCAAIISSSSKAAASSSAMKAALPSSTNSTTTITKTSTSSVILPVLSTAPFHAASNTTKVIASTGKLSTTSPAVQFTGAASRLELSVAGLIGVAGLVAGLL